MTQVKRLPSPKGVDNPIDAFLSEDEQPAVAALGESNYAGASVGPRLVSAWGTAVSWVSEQSTSRLDSRQRELWSRGLLIAAGLLMIGSAGLLIVDRPQTAERPVALAPLMPAMPLLPAVTSPDHPTSSESAAVVVAETTNAPVIETSTIAGAAASASPTIVERASERASAFAAAPRIGLSGEDDERDSAAGDVLPSAVTALDLNPAVAGRGAPRITELAEATPYVTRATPAEMIMLERVEVDKTAIDNVLAAYKQSYNALDADTASTIWQGLDVRALRRAFSTLSRQDLSFDRCDIALQTDRATASCTGVLNYVRKVGDGDQQQRRMAWTIDLRRNGDRWLISNVTAR